ncbi:MAG: carboxyvinyl-carboxyphosphonate phosphorylmutase, partial [Proteobacteria bacterium]|nr:carboxyvinyl-carboxyphosphonate phosphorylmutase [Pseudomonadota bacterium]
AKAMQKAMEELKDKGTTQRLVNEMMAFEEFNDLIGFPEVMSFEAKYR